MTETIDCLDLNHYIRSSESDQLDKSYCPVKCKQSHALRRAKNGDNRKTSILIANRPQIKLKTSESTPKLQVFEPS